jgi:glutamyl-tRNA reductase
MVRKSTKERRNRPLFLIDIAVPRDVDPAVNKLANTYVYDIDDLVAVVQENSSQRRDEAVKAERIVQEEVIRFERWMKTLDIVPTITALKENTEALRKSEIERSLPALGQLTEAQLQTIEMLTMSLADKIINEPILALKRQAGRAGRDTFLDVARKLFNLDADGQKRS